MIGPVDSDLGFKPETDVGFVPEGVPNQTNSAPANSSGTDWATLYAGLDGLDQRVKPEQSAAFKNLDATSKNPKDARAASINKTYYESQIHNLPSGTISGNWPAARNAIGKTMFGQTGDVSDEQLYNLTAKHLTDTEFTRKLDWQNASPVERFGQIIKNFPKHFGDNASEALEAGKGALKPFKEVVEAPKDLPNMPEMGLQNPALVGGIWNSVAKPLIEGVESPLGVATLGVAGELTAAKAAGSKLAGKGLAVMQGVFAALMGKQAVDATPAAMKVLNNPNAPFQAKVEAVGATVGPALMAATSALGAVHEVRPDLVEKLSGNLNRDVETLNKEAAKAPVAESEHLMAASRELAKVAPEPPSEAAQAWDEVKKVFAPASRGPEAEVAAGALREHGAELAQRTDRAAAALEDSSKALMKLAPDQRWAVVDRIEHGEQMGSPEMQEFAKATRAILDTKREEIRALGTGKLEHFIEDYFPHIWKDPEKAELAFRSAIGKAPLEGSKAFLKQRTIPTTAEGIALGLEPASSNPVELVLLKAREMDKYLLGQKWLAEMKEKNLVKFVRSTEAPPEGYEPINDKIATVYGDPSHPGAVQIEGKYYAPSSVATVANNYLSPGLRKHASFRGYLTAANSLNQFQLGASAFHLGFTSLDASISKLALAIEYGAKGKIGKAAKETAKVPFAPISNILRGNKVLKEWMAPGTQGEEFGKVVDAMRQAGGRAKMDAFYQTTITKRMMEMFSEGGVRGTIGGLWRAPLAALEQTSRPIMEYVVPRQKLGVFADMVRKDLEKLPPTATVDEQRAVFGKAWDSVDNRMGQMVYDNLFWHKAVKDLSMASVRSVGWNLGTFRELGGGLKDAANFAKNAATPGANAEFTRRMAYTAALPILTGVLGATYQYLHTGKGPEELRDYFFPKTGEKDPQGRDVRLSIPTYMKDVYHYAHDLVGTVEGKVHPAISTMFQMLNNKDYFGRDIRNSDDPLVKQMAQEAKYFADTFTPIGIRQRAQSEAAGVGLGEQAANFVGVTRAPAWVGETSAEQLAGKLAGDKFKSSKAPDAKVVADRQKIQTALRNGDAQQKEQAMSQLSAMVESGEITQAQKRNLVKGTDHTYLENAVSHLDAKEAMRVFKEANMAERQSIREAVEKKILHAHLPQDDRRALVEQLEKLSPRRDVTTNFRQ